MKLSFSTAARTHVDAPISGIDLHTLFAEPLLSAWSCYGDGQLGLSDVESGLSVSVIYVGNKHFFLDWHGDGRMVVYDGSGTESYVTTEMGGDPFRIPLACLVDGTTAEAALSYAARYKARDPTLNWVLMGDVPFEVGWFDC